MINDNVRRNLIYINANFGTLANYITKLEISRLSLYDSIKINKDINIISYLQFFFTVLRS